MSAENSCDVCRVFRTRQHGSSLVLGNTITSRQCCAAFIASATKDNFQDRHSDVLNGLAPSYRAADCTVVSAIPGRRQLWFATSGQLYIPRTRTVTFGPRSFKVCGPTIWNDLPARMKDPSLSFDSFRKLLKTFLFDKWLLHERICGSCINLRGEMFIIIIIITVNLHIKETAWHSYLPLKSDFWISVIKY